MGASPAHIINAPVPFTTMHHRGGSRRQQEQGKQLAQHRRTASTGAQLGRTSHQAQRWLAGCASASSALGTTHSNVSSHSMLPQHVATQLSAAQRTSSCLAATSMQATHTSCSCVRGTPCTGGGAVEAASNALAGRSWAQQTATCAATSISTKHEQQAQNANRAGRLAGRPATRKPPAAAQPGAHLC